MLSDGGLNFVARVYHDYRPEGNPHPQHAPLRHVSWNCDSERHSLVIEDHFLPLSRVPLHPYSYVCVLVASKRRESNLGLAHTSKRRRQESQRGVRSQLHCCTSGQLRYGEHEFFVLSRVQLSSDERVGNSREGVRMIRQFSRRYFDLVVCKDS